MEATCKRRKTKTPIGQAEPNPSGLCKCGCGKKTTRTPYLYRDGVRFHDAHREYVHGHHPTTRRSPSPQGDESPAWRGGRALHKSGYVTIWVGPDDPLRVMAGRTSHIFEHRLVMARYLGRPLARHEQVHHINGDRADNRIENLQLRIGAHGAGQTHVCLDCGSTRVAPTEIA